MNKKIMIVLGIVILGVLALTIFLPKPGIIEPKPTDNDNNLSYTKEEMHTLKRFSSEKEIYNAFLSSESTMGQMMIGMEVRAMETTQDAASGDGASYSQTNVQVKGVDEADIIKTDGDYIYILKTDWGFRSDSQTELIIVSSYPNSEIISKTTYENIHGYEMFIDDGKVIIFGNSFVEYDYLPFNQEIEDEEVHSAPGSVDYGEDVPSEEILPEMERSIAYPGYYRPRLSTTIIKIINVDDKTNPVTEKRLEIEGNYLTSRKIEDNVYFVLNSYPKHYMFGIDDITCEGLVPLYRDTTDDLEKEMEPFVPCNLIGYVPPVQAESFLTIVGISLDDLEVNKEVILGSGHNVYSSTENLYVTYTSWPWFYDDEENYQKTIISKFSLDNGNINYLTTGDVKGRVLNQFSMDEYNGYFRIATTFNEGWGVMPRLPVAEPVMVRDVVDGDEEIIIDNDAENNPADSQEEPIPIVDPVELMLPRTENMVYVLDEDLEVVGLIDGIAPGERIYSARFMGDKGYIITFVEVDPLFVIDLKDPKNPTILGELKIPGYSSYLHPYSENYLIGIGKEVLEVPEDMQTWPGFVWEQGVKISLFDVTDLENPIELYKEVIGDRGSHTDAINDHKSFFFDKQRDLLIIPVTVREHNEPPENVWEYGEFKYQGMFVYNITPQDGFTLKGTIAHKENFESYYSDFYNDAHVKRSLYINNILYTFSNSKLKLNDLSTLEFLEEVNLN